MKKYKCRVIIAELLFAMIFLQLVAGVSPITAISDASENIITEEKTKMPEIPSHSSPYYFPIQRSSTLFTDEENNPVEDNSPQSPSSAWYYNQISINVYLAKSAYLQGESVAIDVVVYRNLSVLANYPISLRIYLGYYRYSESHWANSAILDSIELITDQNGHAQYNFTDTMEEGIYTIITNDYSSYSTYRDFSVGNIGIFFKGGVYYTENQAYTGTIQIVNITDFSAIPEKEFNFNISGFISSTSQWTTIAAGSGATDGWGFAPISTYIPKLSSEYYSLLLEIQTLDGSAQFLTYLYKSWDWYYYDLWAGQEQANKDGYQFIVTTDKTIYSPGETINLRALVVAYSYQNETRELLPFTPIDITVYNPENLAIFWTTLTTDASGVLGYQFSFDQDCDTGLYAIKFELNSVQYSYQINVQYYEKPVFRVEIDTYGKDFYPETPDWSIFSSPVLFEGDIVVEYYFGQPVIGANVEITFSNYMGEEQYTLSGKTNGLGKFQISVNLNDIANLEYSFTLKASVTDEYDRSTGCEKTYSRIEEIWVWGYLTEWAPSPLKPAEFYFSAYQLIRSIGSSYYWNYELNPLMNITANIRIYGIKGISWYNFDLTHRTMIDEFTSSTNNFGAGHLTFQLDLTKILDYNFFEIEVVIDLEDGRSAKSSTYYRYSRYQINLDISTPRIVPGDSLKFSVQFQDILSDNTLQGEVELYIYDSDHHQLSFAAMMIDKFQGFSVPISQYAPHGTYYIYSYIYCPSNDYYGGFEYASDYQEFKVGHDLQFSFSTNGTYQTQQYSFYSELQIRVNSGDVLHISGGTNITTNLPIRLEIYKRGLLYSIPLVLISEEFAYDLQITSEFGPTFTIMAYLISDSGRVFEYYEMIGVDYTTEFTITTDKSVYEPGDTLTLTITPAENSSGIFGISFIDSAVLDVAPEDDSELAYLTFENYWAYVQSGSSWGMGFDRYSYWWGGISYIRGGFYPLNYGGNIEEEIYFDAANLAPGVRSDDKINPDLIDFNSLLSKFDTEIRENISESANWIPRVMISTTTNLTFTLPDNIGEWTIRVVGCTLDAEGNGILLGGDIQTIAVKSFLPFFIEFEVPKPVTQDDIISIKGYVYNYIGLDVNATVAINAPGFIILNNPVQTVILPDKFVSEVEFSLYCKDAYLLNITLLAATNSGGELYSDAKLLPIYIKPNGVELRTRTLGYLTSELNPVTLNLTVDSQAIYHQETLALFTQLMDVSIDSWASLIGYPYGCVEQTMSKLVPSALIYQYLQSTDQLSEDLAIRIAQMVFSGLSRIYTFQHYDGGWGWWEGDDSQVHMTAIVLTALTLVEQAGFQINQVTIQKAVDYLITHQDALGSWTFAYYSASPIEATAFVSRALIHSSYNSTEITSAIQMALNWFETMWATPSDRSAYGAVLYILATSGSIYANPTFSNSLIQYLLENFRSDDSGIYWDSPDESPWYWRNLGNRVEITAYAMWVLALDDILGHYAVIQNALKYILNQRNTWGWWNTADTSAAIVAITALNNLLMENNLIDFDGIVGINVNFQKNPQWMLNFSDNVHQPMEIMLDLTDSFELGDNNVVINGTGNGTCVYLFESISIVRALPSISVPSELTVTKSETFNLSMNLTPNNARFSLKNVNIFIEGIPESMVVVSQGTSLIISAVKNSTPVNFTFQAPSIVGDYEIGGVRLLCFIEYFDPINNSSSTQFYQRYIGPITIHVQESQQEQLHRINPKISQPSVIKSQSVRNAPPVKSTTTSTLENLVLMKSLSKSTLLVPGEIIEVLITIQNDGHLLQYYALDEDTPAGTQILVDTITVSGDLITSDVTIESTASGIHLFFAEIPVGSIQIHYKLQIVAIKNSAIGSTSFWGMYDNSQISVLALMLENIPQKYDSFENMYQDLDNPVISSVNAEQLNENTKPTLKFDIDVFDFSQIYKIRVIYHQSNIWRVRTFYFNEKQLDFTVIVDDFDNINSNIEVYIEVMDIYGNIQTFTKITLPLLSTWIPYIKIGLLVGISIGLATVPTWLIKRKQRKILQLETPAQLKDQSFLNTEDLPNIN